MKMSKSIIINASADKVWTILAHEFATIGEWASGVAHSTSADNLPIPAGATVGGRVCTVPGIGNINETFTHYDESAKTYTFKAEGMPFFITSAANTWDVNATGQNQSEVSFSLDMKFMPIIGTVMQIPMRMQVNTLLQNAVEELKYYAETGEIHPRKVQAQQKALRQATAN